MNPFNPDLHDNLTNLDFVHTQSAPDPHPCAPIPFDQYVSHDLKTVVIVLEDGTIDYCGPTEGINLI